MLLSRSRRCARSFSVDEWEVRVTPQALEQIRDAVVYVRDELCMPQAAQRLFDDLTAAIDGLSTMPRRFRVVDVEPLLSAGVRRMNVRKYSVFYTVSDGERHVVHVFAVLYGTPSSQRLKNLFLE